MIEITSYQPRWPQEFVTIGRHLRHHLGDLALRIYHIGSTSVPNLAAKDLIDVQVSVAELSAEVETAFLEAGYTKSPHVRDHVPPNATADPDQWRKMLFKAPSDQRPVNVHVRILGRANQRYALLFRDYLRAHPPVALAYAQVKMALAKHHPEDDAMEVYYDVKDPVCDIIMGGADAWAAATGWEPGPSDC